MFNEEFKKGNSMENQKPIEFHATAGSYFVVFLVVGVLTYIPLLGWAFAYNFMAEWVADNGLVNGKKVKYNAGYGETLKFIFVNSLLLLITLGIYIFWFMPKMYTYFANHVSYGGGEATPVAAALPPTETQTPTVPPAAPTPPAVPTPPVVQ